MGWIRRDKQNFDPKISSILTFRIGSGTSFSPHFVYKKCFSFYILLIDQISLLDCLYFLRYWSICVLSFIVCFLGCGVTNFEINLIFLLKQLFRMTKTLRQKNKYFENKKSFQGEIKSIFIIFKGLSIAKNCLRPENAPLISLKCPDKPFPLLKAFPGSYFSKYSCTSLCNVLGK